MKNIKSAESFAPINIALVKYWGKRNIALNLPVTDSLSLSAKHTGTTTKISLPEVPLSQHQVFLNQHLVAESSEFHERLTEFLKTVTPNSFFKIETQSDIPVAAGLASSASGYASIVLALNKLLDWNASPTELSVLARQGSGSACRSLWPGLVHWKKGLNEDGQDSHGEPLSLWPELSLGVILLTSEAKKTSSRDGMTHCQETSPLYSNWPELVRQDIKGALEAIAKKDFQQLGEITEHSSEAMHACMRASKPTLDYSLPETYECITQIKALRKRGLPIYFTQDAGPNIKVLFLDKDLGRIQEQLGELMGQRFLVL